MNIDFSALHLIIGDTSPSAEKLKQAFLSKEDTFSSKNTHYRISKEILDNNFFWIYARYGSSKPYTQFVYNTANQEEENNPRSSNQIEQDKQLFILYCAKTLTLYISNTKKKQWLEEYLKSKLEQDVIIKFFFENVDTFLKKIKTVEKVKFVSRSNIFTPNGSLMQIFPNPEDLYGLGSPESFTLEAKFSKVNKTEEFINFFKNLIHWKNNCEAESLVCIGRDDKNLESIFNADNFIQKVNFEVDKDEQGFYDPDTVKEKLIKKIGALIEKGS